MTLTQLAKKLRQAADVLDDLIGIDRGSSTNNDIPSTARQIISTIRRGKYKKRSKYRPKKQMKMKAKKQSKKKAFSYKGKHWTQRPENKERLREILSKAAKTRRKTAA